MKTGFDNMKALLASGIGYDKIAKWVIPGISAKTIRTICQETNGLSSTDIILNRLLLDLSPEYLEKLTDDKVIREDLLTRKDKLYQVTLENGTTKYLAVSHAFLDTFLDRYRKNIFSSVIGFIEASLGGVLDKTTVGWDKEVIYIRVLLALRYNLTTPTRSITFMENGREEVLTILTHPTDLCNGTTVEYLGTSLTYFSGELEDARDGFIMDKNHTLIEPVRVQNIPVDADADMKEAIMLFRDDVTDNVDNISEKLIIEKEYTINDHKISVRDIGGVLGTVWEVTAFKGRKIFTANTAVGLIELPNNRSL